MMVTLKINSFINNYHFLKTIIMKATRFLSAALMAAALVGCSQEEQFGISQEGQVQFIGSFEQVGSRVTMGDDNMMNWEANTDLVSIFPGITVNNQYKVSAVTDGKASFTFVDYVEPEGGVYSKTVGKVNYALYPYADANSITANGTMTASVPATFNYDGKENSIKTALMAAKSESEALNFKNVQGILRLRLNADQPYSYGPVKAITLTSTTAALSGEITITFDDNGFPVGILSDEFGYELTLNLSKELQKGLPSASTGKYSEFYIPVVPTSFEAGDVTMTIDWKDEDIDDYNKVISTDFNIERRKIYTLSHTIDANNSFDGNLEGALEEVSDAFAATEAFATTTGVKIADATTATISTPITIPVKSEEDAAKGHVIEFATMPATPVYIEVAVAAEGSAKQTVENLEVIIPESATSGSLNINAPGTTVTIKATDGTVIETIEAVTAENTLIIESGVTVNNLIVKGGNVEVYGKVGNISRAEDNTDDITYIYLKELGSVVSCAEIEIYVIGSDNNQNVYTFEQLQAALNNAVAGNTEIVFAKDITGDVNILQKENINLVINGNNKKYDGKIIVNGNARAKGTETLTFKSIKFETENNDFTFISAPSKIDNKYNYSHNVTIEDCTFNGNHTVGSASFTGTYNFVMKNCSATNMHSILQTQSCDNNVLVDAVTVTNCKSGLSFGNTAYPTLKNSTINATEYGVRGDGNASRGNLVIENTTITANKPVIIRKMTTDNYNVKFDAATTLQANGLYQVVFTNGQDDAAYVAPTGNFSIEGADNFNVYPRDENKELFYVTTQDQFIEALENGKNVKFTNDIKIEPAKLSNAYGKTGINVKNGQTIDGNGYTLNIKGAGGTWDSGINTTGGLIKNITVTGSFRGIFINHTSEHSEKVVLENVTIGGNGTVYTISCDQGLYQGIEATNCTFNGWTSFAKDAGEAKFINCSFGEGSGYKYCRPYSNTEFVNCTFCPGYAVDTTRATVTFTDCTWEE